MTNAWTEEQVSAHLARFGKVKPLVSSPPIPVHKFAGRIPTEIDGYFFQSQAEAKRYEELKLLQQAGEIFELEVHPKWPIRVNHIEICWVVCDFMYCDKQKFLHVEDIKRERIDKKTGKVKFTTNTRSSKIGQRLLLAVHGVKVEIVKP